MRVQTDTCDIEVSWWIDARSRERQLAIDRYENGRLADLPDSFPVASVDDAAEVLRNVGAADAGEVAQQLWANRPT